MEDDENLSSSESVSSLPATIAVIAITLLVYFIYILRWKPPVNGEPVNRILLLRSLGTRKSTHESSQHTPGSSHYTTCTSPNCVRCKKYEIVKVKAQEKLTEFKQLSGDSGLNRILTSLHDLKSLPAQPLQNPNVLYVPGLRSQPFWSSSDEFNHETNLLERQWVYIAREFESIYQDSNSTWLRNNTETGSWSVFYFYNQGERLSENCQKCPHTVALIESLSSFMKVNIFGNAFFSVLDSGTEVAEHCGPCNIRIRCHLGLRVPEKTSVTVGGEAQSYILGCCVYFDDSFTHSSANMTTSDEARAVLLVDLWHPDLTMKERDALNFVFPAVAIS